MINKVVWGVWGTITLILLAIYAFLMYELYAYMYDTTASLMPPIKLYYWVGTYAALSIMGICGLAIVIILSAIIGTALNIFNKETLCDSREPWELREMLICTGWEQKALLNGDMCFDSHDKLKIGATRKTLGDLLNSIGDVFAYQLEVMLEEYDINIFLFETMPIRCTNDGHIITDIGASRFTRTEVFNWLHRWQAKGFILERWPTLEHTAERLNELYALYQKPYSLSGKSKKYADDRVLALPSGLRGKLGQTLLESYSIAELCTMSTKQLIDLDSIGEKRATMIVNHLHKKPKMER
jgi:ERCC4-type nuclease